jgi:hypothetical protein
MIKLERHRLGPRCYVLGQRVHEYQVGIGLLAAVAVMLVGELVRISAAAVAPALVGTWLVLKDWRDLIPAKRDTAAWRVGIHRPPARD